MGMAMAGGFVSARYTRRSLSNWLVSPATADEDTLFTLRRRVHTVTKRSLR